MPDEIDKTNLLDSNKLVSVIIPVFNVRPYLVEALDSVLQQTYNNLEIIIIDDGSTDGSGALCDEYAKRDSRVCVIHQVNKGLSSARNAGLDMMNGEVVVFLDPDDAYHPDYVDVMMTAMLCENAEIVMCGYTIHKTTGKMRQSVWSWTWAQAKPGMYDRANALRALVDVQFWKSMANRFNSAFGLFDEASGNPFHYKVFCLAPKFMENFWRANCQAKCNNFE